MVIRKHQFTLMVKPKEGHKEKGQEELVVMGRKMEGGCHEG